jgi:hypothetical protein
VRAGSLGGVEGDKERLCHERGKGITAGVRLSARVVVPVVGLVSRQRAHTHSVAVESCGAIAGSQSRPIL